MVTRVWTPFFTLLITEYGRSPGVRFLEILRFLRICFMISGVFLDARSMVPFIPRQEAPRYPPSRWHGISGVDRSVCESFTDALVMTNSRISGMSTPWDECCLNPKKFFPSFRANVPSLDLLVMDSLRSSFLAALACLLASFMSTGDVVSQRVPAYPVREVSSSHVFHDLLL